MKTKLLALGGLMIALNGCVTHRYLPKPQTIDVNHYGSFITVENANGKEIQGELISLDTNQLLVLTEYKATKLMVAVPVINISGFTLQYAQQNYGWSIPLFGLSTISHGYFALLTAPVNLAVTAVFTASGKNAFQYNQQDISYEQLAMFARFPQGLPPGIDPTRIKPYTEPY